MKIPEDKLELLRTKGFKGRSLDGAILFCDLKINEYWVDIPRDLRDTESKEMAKICNEFKKLRKELNSIKSSCKKLQ